MKIDVSQFLITSEKLRKITKKVNLNTEPRHTYVKKIIIHYSLFDIRYFYNMKQFHPLHRSKPYALT